MRRSLLTALLITTASTLSAQSYIGVTGTYLSEKEDGFTDTNPIMTTVIFGANVNPNLGVEGRVGFGLAADGPATYDVDIKNQVGLYFKPFAEFDEFKAYGLIGLSQVQFEIESDTSVEDRIYDRLSYGLGVERNLFDQINIVGEWISYARFSNASLSGLSLGVMTQF